MRNVRKKSAATFCFPGAKVTDILEKIPNILAKHPQAQNVVVLIGCNDIPSQSSELLKRDFTNLLDSLTVHSKQIFISGAIPQLNCGVDRFSRTLRLHTWLKLTCAASNVTFVDNFNLIWKCPAFFHPNGLGSRTLTDNLFYSIWNFP